MFADGVIEFTNTTGVGSYNLTGAVGTRRNFGQDFTSGAQVGYFAQIADGSKWEQGRGVLTIGGTRTLTRTVTKSSSGGAAVNWSAGDVAAGIYVFCFASADVLAGFTRGNRQTTQPYWQQPGGQWHDNSAAGREVEWYMAASGALTEKGRLDTASGHWIPNVRRPWIGVGAANRTVAVSEIGYCFAFDGTVASRTLTLPALASAFAGFEIHAVIDSHAFYLNIQPQAGDTIEYGSPGAAYTLQPRVLVRIVSQGGVWRIQNAPSSIGSQVFVTPGSFIYSASLFTKFVWVRCQGAGGGGGGGTSPDVSTLSPGAGGGSGAFTERLLTVNQANGQTVTVGAGGAAGTGAANGGNGGQSSLGSLVTAPGGLGGASNTNPLALAAVNGGLGGSAGTGDFSSPGNNGGHGIALTLGFGLNATQTGFGGAGFWGGGGSSFVASSGADGNAGRGYGSGGGGGCALNGTQLGGPGAGGCVYIVELR